MLPIIGPTPNQGQSQSSIVQENESDGENNAGETEDSSSKAGRDVKLDLGNSGDGGVHEKTAQLVLQKKVSIEIEQRVSVSASFSKSGSPNGSSGQEVNAEKTARQLFSHTQSLFTAYSAQSDKTEAEALSEFKQKAREGIDAGFEKTRQEIGGDPSETIDQLLKDVRTALDRFLDIFEGDNSKSQAAQNSNTASESANASQASENAAAAEGRPRIPRGLIRNISGQSAGTLTNFAG